MDHSQFVKNCLDTSVKVLGELTGIDPHHTIASIVKPAVAEHVPLLSGSGLMKFPINLNDKSGLLDHKINDIGADRGLLPDMNSK